jgi:hypothetical protein
MKQFKTLELLTELRIITEEGLELATKKLAHLGENQLNWSPTADSWSISEVLAHLNSYSSYYNNALSERIQNTKFREPKELFVSSPLGRSAWISMKLGNAKNIKRKFKAPRTSNPRYDNTLVKGNDFELFIAHQNTMLDILEKAKTINIRKAKVKISISRIIRLRFGDALMFVIYHNQRHMQQIINLMQHPKFPKKHAES